MQQLHAISIDADIERALLPLRIDRLQIEVTDGCAYLRGQARCYETKHAAGTAAQRAAPGVQIVNEVRVAGAYVSNDERLARDVEAAVEAIRPGIAGRVHVTARDGTVSLTGTVLDAREREAIEAAAWRAACVARVKSHLALAQDVTRDVDIAASLNEYVGRAMNLAAGVVSVLYAGGVATLEGTVVSSRHALAIEDLVRWHDRVEDVVNELRVGSLRALPSGPGR